MTLNMPEAERYYWQPLSLHYLVDNFKLTSWKVLLPLLTWVILICCAVFSASRLMPTEWLTHGNKEEVIKYFIFLPTVSVGLLLMFWAGFEWAFIPVFISSFAVAFNSGIGVGWSLLFGFSFIFSLALFGLAYQSLRVPYDLRSFKSISFFISISFIASLASSLGAFIWSLSHDLSAVATSIIWKSWWTGVFFQSILIIGPLLFFFTPAIEQKKQQYYDINITEEVSLNWIYGTVLSITSVLVVFIFAGQWLGKYRVNEVLSHLPNIMRGDVIGALDTFEIIIWLSMALILITGFTSIYVIGSWNQQLRDKVDERTEQLQESQQELKKSLEENKLLLKETHHRVKNNLAQVQALLRLQMVQVDDENYRRLIEDSCSRIQSMSLIHKALYNAEQYTTISLKPYLKKLATMLHQSFAKQDNIDLAFDMTDYSLSTKQGVPLGLMFTEILINAHKYAFEGQEHGTITISMNRKSEKLELIIQDDGVGFSVESAQKKKSLGMQLIQKLSRQLSADLTIESNENGSLFAVSFAPAS